MMWKYVVIFGATIFSLEGKGQRVVNGTGPGVANGNGPGIVNGTGPGVANGNGTLLKPITPSTPNRPSSRSSSTTTVPVLPILAPVTALMAAALSPTSVSLSWANSSSPATTSFRLERAVSDGAFVGLIELPATTTSFVDTSIQAGILYTYRVVSLTADGRSATSGSAQALTPIPAENTLDGVTSAFAVATSGSVTAFVEVFDAADGQLVFSTIPFNGFSGPVTTAIGDVDGDGILDLVVGAGAGGGPAVKIYSGSDGSEMLTFFAFEPTFTGGVSVALGDVNGDGKVDVVVGAGPGGGPRIRAFDIKSRSVLADFFAFEPEFLGGVNVAVGDINGDGDLDIIVGAGPGGAPRVRAFDVETTLVLADFFAYEQSFRGGVNIGSIDVDSDGRAEIITGSGIGGGPRVRIVNGFGKSPVDFFPYEDTFRGGVNIGAGKVNGTSIVYTAPGQGGGPRVRLVSAKTSEAMSEIYPFDSSFRGGISVSGGHL